MCPDNSQDGKTFNRCCVISVHPLVFFRFLDKTQQIACKDKEREKGKILHQFFSSNLLITFAGFPAITQLASNFPATTAPAPTTQPSPSTVPFRMILLHPMKQFLPILISLLGTRSLSPPFSSRNSLFLVSASIG